MMTRDYKMRLQHDRGYTLIETLTIICVTIFLISIALPAIQNVRESARRLQCANHLRQIGIAMASYQSACSAYPLLYIGIVNPNGIPIGGGFFSIHTYILPYIEQGSAINSLNFSVFSPSFQTSGNSVDLTKSPHPANSTVGQMHIATFICPSDPIIHSGEWGGTNYRSNLGTVLEAPSSRSTPVPIEGANGAFQPFDALPPSAFRDGLSNTVSFSEKPRGRPSGRFNAFAGYWFGQGAYTSADGLLAVCRSLKGEPSAFQNDVGNIWMLPYHRYTFYNHNLNPNREVPDCVGSWNNRDPAMVNGLFTARSHHRGGVNVLYMDGRATFATNSIELGVWRAIGTRNGGEQIKEN